MVCCAKYHLKLRKMNRCVYVHGTIRRMLHFNWKKKKKSAAKHFTPIIVCHRGVHQHIGIAIYCLSHFSLFFFSAVVVVVNSFLFAIHVFIGITFGSLRCASIQTHILRWNGDISLHTILSSLFFAVFVFAKKQKQKKLTTMKLAWAVHTTQKKFRIREVSVFPVHLFVCDFLPPVRNRSLRFAIIDTFDIL